jgi:hypothetical protein
MARGLLPLLALAVALAAGRPGEAAVFPRDTPPGQCHWVHGRMALYNGTFSFRIWVIGTHRMLRVVDKDGDNFNDLDQLPPALSRALAGYRDDVLRLSSDLVFADYRICAFTRSRHGVMQSVTLEDARHVRIDKAPPPE